MSISATTRKKTTVEGFPAFPEMKRKLQGGAKVVLDLVSSDSRRKVRVIRHGSFGTRGSGRHHWDLVVRLVDSSEKIVGVEESIRVEVDEVGIATIK